jgi:hypothetical protein
MYAYDNMKANSIEAYEKANGETASEVLIWCQSWS